jgi:hypothetical protein
MEGRTHSAPNEQATGFPTPIEGLRGALASMPNFTNNGDSFSGDFSGTPGGKAAESPGSDAAPV